MECRVCEEAMVGSQFREVVRLAARVSEASLQRIAETLRDAVAREAVAWAAGLPVSAELEGLARRSLRGVTVSVSQSITLLGSVETLAPCWTAGLCQRLTDRAQGDLAEGVWSLGDLVTLRQLQPPPEAREMA